MISETKSSLVVLLPRECAAHELRKRTRGVARIEVGKIK